MARKLKAVYFNTRSEADLLTFADGLENFSEWVKAQIQKQLGPKAVDPAVAELVERLVSAKLAGITAMPNQKQKQFAENILLDIDRFF